MEKSRLFVGTFLDAQPAAIVSALKDLNPDLSGQWHLKARFVPRSKLHLTWLFIGDVEKELIESVKSDLKAAVEAWKCGEKNHSFSIEYDAIKVWSSLRSPRVLVFESTAVCPQAAALNLAIAGGLAKYCQKAEPVQRFRHFRPHLTVCRFSQESHKQAKCSLSDFQTPENLFPLVHKIDTVSLIESNLNAGANGYSSILDLALGKPQAPAPY